MNKKSINLTLKDIIIARDNICKTKTRYWRIIKSENVISTKAIKAGMGSGFDLNALYNKITQMADNLIKIKLMINAINSGITIFNYDDAKKTHYYNIYDELCFAMRSKIIHYYMLYFGKILGVPP